MYRFQVRVAKGPGTDAEELLVYVNARQVGK
jgi:hypothetical protein